MADQNLAKALDTSAPPAKLPVSFWLARKRPPEPQHDADRKARNLFDVLFAGAAAAGRWELEFTLIGEDEFDKALQAVARIQMGGR